MSAISAMSTVDLKVPLARPSADELELAEGRVILERKSLGQVLLSRYGLALLALVPLTIGHRAGACSCGPTAARRRGACGSRAGGCSPTRNCRPPA